MVVEGRGQGSDESGTKCPGRAVTVHAATLEFTRCREKFYSPQRVEIRWKTMRQRAPGMALRWRNRAPRITGLVMKSRIARQVKKARKCDREVERAERQAAALRELVDRRMQQDELRRGRKMNAARSTADRARVHKYCKTAPLLERGEIIDEDEAVLMGAILMIAALLKDRAIRKEAWIAGHANYLRLGKSRRRSDRLKVHFETAPPDYIRDILRAAVFAYDPATTSWSGDGDVAYARELIGHAKVAGTAEIAEASGDSTIVAGSDGASPGTTPNTAGRVRLGKKPGDLAGRFEGRFEMRKTNVGTAGKPRKDAQR